MRQIATATLVALMLAGCGGGGGDDSGPPAASSGPAPDSSPASDSLTTSQARSLASQDGLRAAQRAAESVPRFGSVTQSTNRDGSGITTDRAHTTFSSGPRLVVEITRQGENSLSLDTDLHTVDYDVDTSQVTGREFAQAVVLKHSSSALTLGLVATDWDSTDTTDYLAGGYWLHVTGDIYEGDVTGAEMGAFVDGPEIRGTPNLPLSGTATYNGPAAGLYASRYGTDAAVPQGTHELGEFSGALSLIADFGTQNIAGTVDNINLAYVLVTPDGAVEVGEGSTAYRLNLGAASFGSTGTFTGSDITLTHPQLSISSSGSWGGRFSTTDDSAGNPRLVAGTLGGTGTTPGGTTASFVGAFYGATPQFE